MTHADTPQDIGHILKVLKATTELGKNLEQAKIWKNWTSIIPAPYHEKSFPLRVKDRVLYIEVESAVFTHKMSYLKGEILENIQRIISSEIIEDIRLQLEHEDRENNRKK
jgi:hypothetical protein